MRHEGGAAGVGVDAVWQKGGLVGKGGVQVDERKIRGSGDFVDARQDLFAEDAVGIPRLFAAIAEERDGAAENDARLRFEGLEGADKLEIVGDEARAFGLPRL